MFLFAIVAATLPVAALDDRGTTSASAQHPPTAPVQDPAPVPVPKPKPKKQVKAVPPIESRVHWHKSISHGTANGGWLQRGVMLPKEGPGFYTYNPNTQVYPNAPSRRYGTDKLVRDLIALGKWWKANHPNQPRLGIGDLSWKSGGPLDNHASHQAGVDVDIRLPRRDGVEGAANPSNYNQELTQELVDWWTARGGMQYIFYGPNLRVSGGPGVIVWPNHDDHLHIRIYP